MLYNKNNVRKTNDKKILHKVGKQWKVVSVALLMAIGGGAAIATHANAQQTANNNYASNETAQNIAGNDEIGDNAVTPKSASSASAKPAKPASAVSYLSGYNGSAASYHAKAQSDATSYKVNSGIVQNYVNSLNNEFPKQTSSLNSTLNSATDQTNADQSSETSYSAIAAQSNYSSQVSSLAAKANMTSSAYIESVGAQASNFNDEISGNSQLASQMSAVNSYAQLMSNIDNPSNAALSQAYVMKDQSADGSAMVAGAYASNAQKSLENASALSLKNEMALMNDQTTLNNVDTQEAIAIANASADNAFVQSIANVNSNANYANSSSVSNVISAVASATNASNGAFTLVLDKNGEPVNLVHNGNSTVSNVSSTANGIAFNARVKSGKGYSETNDFAAYASADLLQDVSDTAAQLRYSAENASLKTAINEEKANVTKYSNGVDAASAAAQSAQNSYDNASDDASALDMLINYPSLNNLFTGKAENVEYSKSVDKNLASNPAVSAAAKKFGVNVSDLVNTAVAVNGADNVQSVLNNNLGDAEANAIAAVKGALKNNSNDTNVSDIISKAATSIAAKHPNLAKAMALVSKKVTNGNVTDLKAAIADKAGLANVTNGVENAINATDTTVTTPGILNAQSYSAASAAVAGVLKGDDANSANISAINSLTSSANSAVTSASSASASYSVATDENVALASSYANSYSADVNNDKTVQSAAQNSLDNFYATHADTKYATASSNAASLSAAVPSDNAYAEGNGLHVFNYGPKYIIVTKAGQLHTKPDYNTKDDKVVGKVPAGAQLAVKGVDFGQNGVTRYVVNYDGINGLFTANSDFSKQAYLPAYSGVDVTLTKNARVYKDAGFTKATGKTLRAGKPVYDVNVVTMDHKRNGFTRIETQNGLWFTANANYVSLNGTSANNTNKAEAQQLNKSNNPVNFWN